MAIHTFGEYLDFHPHLHALVADGLFDREGRFHVMRTGELAGELAQEKRGTTDAHLAGNHAAARGIVNLSTKCGQAHLTGRTTCCSLTICP